MNGEQAARRAVEECALTLERIEQQCQLRQPPTGDPELDAIMQEVMAKVNQTLTTAAGDLRRNRNNIVARALGGKRLSRFSRFLKWLIAEGEARHRSGRD